MHHYFGGKHLKIRVSPTGLRTRESSTAAKMERWKRRLLTTYVPIIGVPSRCQAVASIFLRTTWKTPTLSVAADDAGQSSQVEPRCRLVHAGQVGRTWAEILRGLRFGVLGNRRFRDWFGRIHVGVRVSVHVGLDRFPNMDTSPRHFVHDLGTPRTNSPERMTSKPVSVFSNTGQAVWPITSPNGQCIGRDPLAARARKADTAVAAESGSIGRKIRIGVGSPDRCVPGLGACGHWSIRERNEWIGRSRDAEDHPQSSGKCTEPLHHSLPQEDVSTQAGVGRCGSRRGMERSIVTAHETPHPICSQARMRCVFARGKLRRCIL